MSTDSQHDLKALAFDYCAGHLSELDKRQVEDAMLDSPELAEYVARAQQVREASVEESGRWQRERGDDVFSALWSQVESAEGDGAYAEPDLGDTAAQRRGGPHDEDGAHDEDDAQQAPLRQRPVWMPYAAAALAALLLGALVSVMTANPAAEDVAVASNPAADGTAAADRGVATTEEQAAAEAPEAEPNEAVPGLHSAPEAEPSAERDARISRAIASLRPVDNPAWDGVLRVSEGADTRTEEGDDTVLKITSGTALVEYLPQPGQSLRVQTPDLHLWVTGTVFVVDVRDGRTTVRVAEGEVRVAPASPSQEIARTPPADAVAVASAQQRTSSASAPSADTTIVRAVAPVVNVEAHRVALTERARATGDSVERHLLQIDDNPGDVGAPQTGNALRAEADRRRRSDARPTEARETEERPAEARQTDAAQAVATSTNPPRGNAPNGEPPAEPAPNDAAPSGGPPSMAIEAALRTRDYEAAARLLESRIAERASTADRLDVARLYLQQLDQPRRAAPHLRAVLGSDLSGGVRESVLDQLCGLGDAVDDARCGR